MVYDVIYIGMVLYNMTVAIRAAALSTLRVPGCIATYICISLGIHAFVAAHSSNQTHVTASLNGLQAIILKNNANLKSDRRHKTVYSIMLTCRQRKHMYVYEY